MRRVGKSFDCPRLLKSCFTACVISIIEYCATVWVSSAVSHLGLLNSVVRSAERLCAGELCCLGHRRKVGTLCLFYNIFHRVGHPINEYLHHFLAGHNTRDSASLGELALVIPRCRTDQFSLSLGLWLWVCLTCHRRVCFVAEDLFLLRARCICTY